MISGKPYNRGWRKDSITGCYGRHNPSPIVSETGDQYPYDILFFDEEETDDWFYCKTCENEADRPFHPTQKPVDLGRYLIRTFTLPGAIVLDNACGCGSFLIAAMREGRRFIGIEKNVGAYHHKRKPVNLFRSPAIGLRQSHYQTFW